MSFAAAPLVLAGDQITVPKEVAVESKDWSIETGSGVQFSNVREGHLDGYTMVPVYISASLKLDDVSLDTFAHGIFRGNTEFVFQPYGYAIAHGPETEIVGMNFGPRYNFVQPGWKVVPFVGALVGFGFADSNPTATPNPATGPVFRGLGQDFNFTFSVDIGARYDFNDDWFTRLTLEYTHFSNAGLSEPAHPNRAIDALGPELAVGRRF